MSFIRAKKINGHTYYQRVESYRCPETGQPKQRVLEHLGRKRPADYDPADERGHGKMAIASHIKTKLPPLPDRSYQVVVADPPWRFHLRESDRTHRGRTPYPPMSDRQILALPMGDICSHYLFLWATKDHLSLGCECLDRWGFELKQVATWVKICKSDPRKVRMGVGHWLRTSTEFVLIGAKKGAKAFTTLGITDLPNVFFAPVEKHSVKPEDIHRLAERIAPVGERLEMFARRDRTDWDTWGGEA